MKPTDLPAPIAAKIHVDAVSGCWLWAGAAHDTGYGRVVWPIGSQKKNLVHRLVWQLLEGPIPDGMTLDHLCRVRLCCYPAHLEITTRAENSRRRGGSPNISHCRSGKHPWIPANIEIEQPGRQRCKRCRQERRRRRRATWKDRKARPSSGQQSFL